MLVVGEGSVMLVREGGERISVAVLPTIFKWWVSGAET